MNRYTKNISSIIAQRRYEKIASIIDCTVKKDAPEAATLTDMLDQVFLNKYLGIPIFLTILWAMFRFTFVVSEPFVIIIERVFEVLIAWSYSAIPYPYLASFISHGILGGLGSVLVFIPPIFGLFLVLSVLEDSGYMARAAFVMDHFMYRLGLHGRSFIPLMIGFGCNVPAIMATRSIDSEKDRMLTMLIAPLISCSARLPVYMLIAGAIYGPAYAGTAVFAVYALGIFLAVAMALVFRRNLFKGYPSPFVLELPAYAVPDAQSALIHTWLRGKVFLKKAGTIIFGATIIIWYLSVQPWEATAGGQIVSESYIGWIGHTIEPMFRPLGWDWRAAVALLSGLIAKEVIVGTYGILLGAQDADLTHALVELGLFTPLTGFAFMAFVLIYVPCVAVIGTIAKETNSLRWPVFVLTYQTILAFVVANIIVVAGRLLGLS
ncbi:MAG: ferrous iron transport protein B [Candidatus Methanosuratincola petrocarbonis]